MPPPVGHRGPKLTSYKEHVETELTARDFLIQKKVNQIIQKLPDKLNFLSEFDSNLYSKLAEKECAAKDLLQYAKEAPNEQEVLNLIRNAYIKAEEELRSILTQFEKALDEQAGDLQWLVEEEKNLVGFEKYYNELPKRGKTDEELKPHIKALSSQVEALRKYVDTVNQMSAEPDSARFALGLRKEKITAIRNDIEITVKEIEDIQYRQKMTIKAPVDPSVARQENEAETQIKLAKAEKKMYDQHNKDILDRGNRAYEESIYAPLVGVIDKRNEVNAKRLEWRQLKADLDALESEFRTKERAELVAKGERGIGERIRGIMAKDPGESPELTALRDKLRLAKIAYRNNIKENVALRAEEKDLRAAAQLSAPVGTPTRSRLPGESATPSEKNPERSLQHSFANRFIFESARESLRVQKEVVAEQRPQIMKTAISVMEMITPKNAFARKSLVWGGRFVGLVAVSGAAAFLAPAIAGTAAAGAATTYAVRLASGMAGGALLEKLANKFYGRFINNRKESQFNSAKVDNVAVMNKATLTEDDFKKAESAFTNAQDNLRVSQRNRTIFNNVAKIVGSFGAASLTELGADLLRPSHAVRAPAAVPQRPIAGEDFPVPSGESTVTRAEVGGPRPVDIGEDSPIPDPVPLPRAPATVRLDPVVDGRVGAAGRGDPRFTELFSTRPGEGVRIVPESAPAPVEVLRLAGIDFEVRDGDLLWTKLNDMYRLPSPPEGVSADRFRELSQAKRDSLLEQVFIEMRASPQLREAIGMGAGGSERRLEIGSTLNLRPLAELMEQKLSAMTQAAPLPEGARLVQAGDTLWGMTRDSFADQFAGVSELERNRVLDRVFARVRADPELMQSIGITSGDVDMIRARRQLNLAPLETMVREELGRTVGHRPPLEAQPPATALLPLDRPTPPSVLETTTRVLRPFLAGLDSESSIAGTTAAAMALVAPVAAGRQAGTPRGRGRMPIISGKDGESEPVAIRNGRAPLPSPEVIEFGPVTAEPNDPRSGPFGQQVREVFGTPAAFDRARKALINRLEPRSLWERLLNPQTRFIEVVERYSLNDFDAVYANPDISPEDLQARLDRLGVPVKNFTAWRDLIAEMRTEMTPDPQVTVGDLVSQYVLRNRGSFASALN